MRLSEYLYRKQDLVDEKTLRLREKKARLEETLRLETAAINKMGYVLMHPVEYAKKQKDLRPLRKEIETVAADIQAAVQKSGRVQKTADGLNKLETKVLRQKEKLVLALIILIDLLIVSFFIAFTENPGGGGLLRIGPPQPARENAAQTEVCETEALCVSELPFGDA